MSGSVPKGLDGTAYQRLVKIVKEAGKPVILDTSGKLLEMGIQAAPTLIKPNIDEIRMLTGKTCDDINDIIEAAKEIHRNGVEIVAVSLGADGSLVVGEEGTFRAEVPKIDAVNTVGCGDAMIAGFAIGIEEGLSLPEMLSLVVGEEGTFRAEVPKIDAVNTVGCGDAMIAGFAIGIEEGLSLPEMLRKASAVSAAAAMREETGFFCMEDMQKLLPEIKITRM